MVIHDSFQEKRNSIKEIDEEISMLYRLGVEDYEIKYLICLKKKREAG